MPEAYERGGNPEIDAVLNQVRDAGLRYPANRLLYRFIVDAKTPEAAAQYVKRRMDAGEVYPMVTDWAHIIESITTKATMPDPVGDYRTKQITDRDHYRCCITGFKGTFWDPLIVASILKVPTGWRRKAGQKGEDRITPMLYAFFGRDYAEWWLNPDPHKLRPKEHAGGGWAMGSALASQIGYVQETDSHWLVRRSAAKAFDRGIIRLDSVKGSKFQYKVERYQLLGTEEVIKTDQNGYRFDVVLGGRNWMRIDPRFLDTHARLSLSIRYVEIARDIAPELLPFALGPPPKRFSLMDLINTCMRHILLAILLRFSLKTRAWVYQEAKKLGRRLGYRGHMWLALPFGLHLQPKVWDRPADDYDNAFNALRLVRKYTTIPVAPEPLDIVPGLDPDRWRGGFQYHQWLLTTHMPGHQLDDCVSHMSDEHIREVAAQLGGYIAQLRQIPSGVENPNNIICNTLGPDHASHSPRFRKWVTRSCATEEEFIKEADFKFPDDPARRGHKIVFSHGNLSDLNVLVDRYKRRDGTTGWKITGIVDWKYAGWMPEYLEYTTPLYKRAEYSHERYDHLMKLAFEGLGDYDREWQVERRCRKLDVAESDERIRKANEDVAPANKAATMHDIRKLAEKEGWKFADYGISENKEDGAQDAHDSAEGTSQEDVQHNPHTLHKDEKADIKEEDGWETASADTEDGGDA